MEQPESGKNKISRKPRQLPENNSRGKETRKEKRDMKKMRRVFAAVLAAAVLCLCMAGCGAGEEAKLIGTCTLTVQDQLQDEKVDIAEGDTVYDILMKTDLAVSGKDTGDGIAIEAIEGVANGDKGEYSGWIYNVNGEMPMDYCDKLEVNDGDEIVWSFSEGM